MLADLTDLANFEHGFPHDLFVAHRAECPVFWHEPTEHTPDGEGFWSVATHAETQLVLRDAATYSSETGGDRPYGGTLLEDLPVAGQVLNMMDDPRHARIRRLVSSGLTPRTIRRVTDDIRSRAVDLLDAVGDDEPFDFLGTVAAELPMQMICLLLGVPASERHWLFEAVEPAFDLRGGEGSVSADPTELQSKLLGYAAELVAAKRAAPGDDMLSIVANAELADAEPGRLTDGELLTFFYLLFAAGSETTRNAIAGGVAALADRPDQFDALAADASLLPTAAEEIIRWTTPSSSKRRTVTTPTELGGHRLRPGEKVLVWEGSANRDERVFERPMELDVARDPNPHVAFGHGAHYCLGAALARLELRVVLEELTARFDAIELAAPIEWTRSNRHTGIRRLQVTMRRRPGVASPPGR